METILCAHDLTDEATPVLRVALDLGRRLQAAVHVLHVVTPPLPASPAVWFAVPGLDVEALEQALRSAAAQELERLLRAARREGDPEPRLHVRMGEPSEGILATRSEIEAGWIVMGTHGRKGWEHLMLGSVAERILRTSPVPVLTISAAAVRAAQHSTK